MNSQDAYTSKMNFQIDDNNISGSFDRIAMQLLLEYVIMINEIEFEITEVEFYYFKEDVHEDMYTHKHMMPSGHWRLHNQGIDVTFEGTDDQDGGVLIRGVKNGEEYINGPKKVLVRLFKSMKGVSYQNCMVLQKKKTNNTEIFKVQRHLPNKVQYEEFRQKKYRYLKNIEKLDLTGKERENIKSNMERI